MASDEQLPRHVDDAIGAMTFSMIGHPSVEARLRHHLTLSQNSSLLLHSQLRDLQRERQMLERKYDASKSEASFNASALKKKIGEFCALKSAYDKLLNECELFQADKEVFAEAAEDAEERRAEADKRAAAAEVRAADAETRYAEADQREQYARRFIQDLLAASTSDTEQILASSEVRERWGVITNADNLKISCRKKNGDSAEHHQFCDSSALDTAANRDMSVTVKQVDSVDTVHDTLSIICRDDRGTKRAYSDVCKAQGEVRNAIRQRIGEGNVNRSSQSTTFHRVDELQTPFPAEKENFDSFDAKARAKIEEAAYSDDQTNRYLASLLMILERNLIKAETEGDLIYRKYCEMQKLLFDTLVTFGIQPEVLEGKISSVSSDASTVKEVEQIEGT